MSEFLIMNKYQIENEIWIKNGFGSESKFCAEKFEWVLSIMLSVKFWVSFGLWMSWFWEVSSEIFKFSLSFEFSIKKSDKLIVELSFEQESRYESENLEFTVSN